MRLELIRTLFIYHNRLQTIDHLVRVYSDLFLLIGQRARGRDLFITSSICKAEHISQVNQYGHARVYLIWL